MAQRETQAVTTRLSYNNTLANLLPRLAIFFSERLSEWGESNIMCCNVVLHLNADQSILCHGTTATEFM